MIATQPTLPIQWHLAHTRRALGTAGEIAVAQALEASGYSVSSPHTPKRGDLLVFDPAGNRFKVEVKTARQNARKEWCFTLFKRWQGRECADHRSCDFVVLLAVLKFGDSVPFVIPCAQVARITAITLYHHPLDYSGKYSTYRRNIKELRLL